MTLSPVYAKASGNICHTKDGQNQTVDAWAHTAMVSIDGADRLSEIWQELRGAHRHDERRALIADAICATSRLEAAVHEARRTAVRAMQRGTELHVDALARIQLWARDYE